MPTSTAGNKLAIFCQVCELIPPHLVPKLACKHGIKSRDITPWSHTVSMLYAQFTHAIGLNDVSDALRANRAAMAAIRGATPPSRNGLSHANKTRNPSNYWSVPYRALVSACHHGCRNCCPSPEGGCRSGHHDPACRSVLPQDWVSSSLTSMRRLTAGFRRAADKGKSYQLKITKGQGHNMWPGWFHCQELVDFVIACAGEEGTKQAAPDPRRSADEQEER